MELMSPSDMSDKDLVNRYGGVAYDHESLPKVVAVHSWTAELQNSYKQGQAPHLPSHELFPPKCCYSMRIDVRSSPQEIECGSKRICTVSRDNLDALFKNKFSHSDTSFAEEKLSQTEERQIDNTRTGEGTGGILRTLLQESSKDTFGKYYQSNNTAFGGKEHGYMSQMCNFLLTENTNSKDMSVTNVLPVDGKFMSSSRGYFLEANKTGTKNLESLDWSRVRVLAEESFEQLNSSCKRLNSNTSSISYLGNKSKGTASGDECPQGQTKEISVPQNVQNFMPPLCNSPEQTQISETPLSSSRKRPRKSFPRKIDVHEEWQMSCSGSDSEGTLIVSDSHSQVVFRSPSHERRSSELDKESIGSGTKVLFKRTAGVWSVSPLHTSSDKEENRELEGSSSSNNEATQDQFTPDSNEALYVTARNKPATNICIFTDRPIASLAPYNPLEPDNDEALYSPALDRETRIKELLSKQEKLLAEVRKKKSGEE